VLAVLVVVVQVVVLAILLLLQELQTRAVEVVAAHKLETLLNTEPQAVAVSSSSAIQTHSEPQQAQQVHQRLLWLEALGSTNSLPLVLLRSSHVGLG
jgi:hypothetical protein